MKEIFHQKYVLACKAKATNTFSSGPSSNFDRKRQLFHFYYSISYNNELIFEMLKILPQLFYQDPKITKALVDGLSCIVHKQLSEPVLRKEGYVSTHAITLVLKGILRAETDEGVAKQVNENEMIFLPKGIYTISNILPRDGVFEAVVFFFDEELIATFINAVNLKL